MSFFPINLCLTEENSLYISDIPVDALVTPTSYETLLSKLANLLAKIEQAANERLSLLTLSENFVYSMFYPRAVFRQNLSIRLAHLHYLLGLVEYIRGYTYYLCPQLFTYPTSLGTQLCCHTIWTLQTLIQSAQPSAPYPLEEPSTSTSTASIVPSIPSPLLPTHPASFSPQIAQKKVPSKTKSTSNETSLSCFSKKRKRQLSENVVPEAMSSKAKIAKRSNQTRPSVIQIASHERSKSPIALSADMSAIGTLGTSSSLQASDDSEEDNTLEPDLFEKIPIKRKSKSPTKKPLSSQNKKYTNISCCPTQLNLPSVSLDNPTTSLSFVSITLSKNLQSFQVTPRNSLTQLEDMMLFLQNAQQAVNCSSYTCLYEIPELKIKNSNNKKFLLQAIYALVIRNSFFFKNASKKPSLFLNQKVKEVLYLINQLYYSLDDIEETPHKDSSVHHEDLQCYQTSPINPPMGISVPINIFWLNLYSVKEKPNHLRIKVTNQSNWHQKYEQLNYLANLLENNLLCCQEFIKHQQLFIQCHDPLYLLEHPQKKPLSSEKALKILQNIVSNNLQQVTQFFSQKDLNNKIRGKDRNTSINDFLEKTNELLLTWEKSFCQATTSLTEKLSTKKKDNPKKTKQVFFPAITYHHHYNSFSMEEKLTAPCSKTFFSFLLTIRTAKQSSTYDSLTEIPEIKPNCSGNRRFVLLTLFKLACRYANLYQEPQPKTEKSRYIYPEMVENFLFTLKTLNQEYCQIFPLLQDIAPDSYHPDLNEIMIFYNSNLFRTNVAHLFSFKLTSPAINIRQKTISITSSTLYHEYAKTLLVQLKIRSKAVFTNIIKITSLPTTTSFSIQSLDESYSLSHLSSKLSVPRDIVLKECLNNLLQIYQKIVTTPHLTPYVHEKSYQTLIKYIEITKSHINAALNNTVPPQKQLRKDLQPLVDVSLFHISRLKNKFLCTLKGLYSHREDKNLISLFNTVQTTCNWISSFLNDTLPLRSIPFYLKDSTTNKNHIIPKNDQGKIYLIPLYYTGLKQNRLQLQQLLKSHRLSQKAKKNVIKPISLIDDILFLIEKKWETYQTTYSLNALSVFPSHMQAYLFLSEVEMQQIEQKLSLTLSDNDEDSISSEEEILEFEQTTTDSEKSSESE